MIDRQRLLQTFLELVRIDSESLSEKRILSYIEHRLSGSGLTLRYDRVGKTVGSDARGNLTAVFRPRKNTPLIGLNAHVDTVKPGRGVTPRVSAKRVRSDGKTVLGADDKAGVAIIIELLSALAKKGSAYKGPGVAGLFTITEEIGLLGGRHWRPGRLPPRYIIALDSGSPHEITVRAPSQNSLDITVRGKSAHSGLHPERGVNALTAAAEGIRRCRWGRISKTSTANIGMIEGGTAVNAVPDRVIMRGEARALAEDTLARITRRVEESFQAACEAEGAALEFHSSRVYDGFHLRADHELRRRLRDLYRGLGERCSFVTTGGGQDANHFNAAGVPAVNIGCGMRNPHTVKEYLDLNDFYKAADIMTALVSRAEH